MSVRLNRVIIITQVPAVPVAILADESILHVEDVRCFWLSVASISLWLAVAHHKLH